MRADLVARLKALGADDRKIASLIDAGFSEQQIERLLSEMYTQAVVKEAVYGPVELVRYKGATMTKNADYDALEPGFDILNRVTDRQGMEASVAVARAMVRTGIDLEAGRAVLKEGKAVYKELSTGPGMELYLRTVKEVGEETVTTALKALIDHYRASKKADAFQRAVQGDLRSDMTPR